MRQEQAVEFLAHQARLFTAQRLVAQAQMSFLLSDARFDLPALVVAEDELDGRSEARGSSKVVTNRCSWLGLAWLLVWEDGNCARRSAVCGSMRYSITRTCTAGSPAGCKVTT